MAGRPGQQAADRSSSPLQALVDVGNRDGGCGPVIRHQSYEGGSPKPQGRLPLDVPDIKNWSTNSGKQQRLLSPKVNINIGTWNIRTLHQEGRTELFMHEIQRFKWDIIGLAETHWIGNGTKTVDGHDIIFSGHDKKHTRGVALLLSKQARQALIAVKPINDRMIYARFQGQGYNLSVIQVYAPTAESKEEDIEEFYVQLQEQIDDIDRNDVLLLMGDWNSKVGKNHTTWSEAIGRYGYGDANERGERLLEFCCANQLSITNTYFQHKESQKWTWLHPSGQAKNMIDFIIVNKRWKNCILDCRSFPSADSGSDHQLVMCKMRLKLKDICKHRNSQRKHDVSRLKDQSVLEEYQQELSKNLPKNFADTHQTLDQAAESYSTIIKAAADNVLGFTRSRKKPWISNSTLDITDQRREIKKQLTNNPELKPRYNQLTRDIRTSINHDYENWCNENCEQLERLQNSHQTHGLHKKIKELTRGTKITSKSVTIKDKNGEILTTERDVRERWGEYCSDLYNYNIKTDDAVLEDLWTNQYQEEIPDVSASEVESAIKKLKPRKAPGTDGVCGELIQYGGKAAEHGIHSICQRAWKEEKFPEVWTKSIIVTIPKKGDLQLCENYRTISLISHASKILLEIVRRRLKPHIEMHLSEEQAGFRPGRSTVEQIFVWKQLAERYLEVQNGELVNVFIDFKKAFDRVWHTGMVRVLQHYNIPRKLVVLIQDLYNQAVSAVRIGTDVSEWFRQTVGVRQGCVLSPDLFNLFLEHVLGGALEAHNGGALMNGRRVSNLRFADDIDLMGETTLEAQEILDTVHTASRRHGLEISKEKTKVLLVAKETREIAINIDNQKLEQVSHFKYLGTEVTEQNSSTTDIRCRIAQALAAVSNLRVIWRNRAISLKTKLRLLDCLVIPTALYGCEAWTMTKADTNRLRAFGMKCLRTVLGITWRDHITNQEITSRTSRAEGYIVNIVQSRQHTWLGHVLRMDGSRLPKMSLQAHAHGTRYRGRPRKSWFNSALECSGLDPTTAVSTANDREYWRGCIRGAYDQ
jgi:exonuclease III